MPVVGITRVADITDLDECKVPVFLAIRPDALTLAVSAGKGLTRNLARLGAVMESIEIWHAEHAKEPDVIAPAREIGIEYELDRLELEPGSIVTDTTRLGWYYGREVMGGRSVPVPAALVHLNATVTTKWKLPTFRQTANGLASGNSVVEAIHHGLLEIIERQCLTEFHANPRNAAVLDLDAVESDMLQELFNQLQHTHNLLQVLDITNMIGAPCYYAEVRNEAVPLTFSGSGCHTSTEVAIGRSVTEAIQSRLAAIAGSRDDLDDTIYGMMSDPLRGRGSRLPYRYTYQRTKPRDSIDTPIFEDDLQLLVSSVMRFTGNSVFWVDLSRTECNVPVVRVVAPGLGSDARTTFQPNSPR